MVSGILSSFGPSSSRHPYLLRGSRPVLLYMLTGISDNRPDLCDGTYDQFCKNTPQYSNITQILQAAGQADLLSYMNTYWLPDAGTAESFWEHEFNKHGSCQY